MATKVTDALGNELAEGATVGFKLGDQFLVAKIVKLNDGGLALPGSGKPQQTQGVIILGIQIPITFTPDPRGVGIGVLFKLVDPNQQQLIQDAVDKADSSLGRGKMGIVP